MKKKLLMSTALVGVAFSLPAMAADPITVSDNYTFQGTYENYLNASDATLGGVAAIYLENGVTVADGTKFVNNKNTAATAGGALKLLNGITMGNNVEFTGNSVEAPGWGGGALYVRLADKTTPATNGEVVIGTNATFEGNTAPQYGGAIALENGKLNIADGATFSNNTAGSDGGAISTWLDPEHGTLKSGIETGKVVFSGNTATSGSGGAIAMGADAGTATFGAGSEFSNNTAGNSGGAIGIANGNEVTVGQDSVFSANSSTQMGGAILNSGTLSVGDGSKFENNTSANSAAIHNATASDVAAKLTVGNNVTFTGNTAEYGGAVINHNAEATFGENVIFSGNKATTGSGGAIVNQSNGDTVSTLTIGNNATFENNEGKSGAAVYQYANGGSNSSVQIGDNARYFNNKASANGGAVALYNGSATLGRATYEGNEAVGAGGAISNMTFGDVTKSEVTIADGSMFLNNKASSGGAVHNAENATLNFGGDIFFAGNMAGDTPNDINNEGQININSGVISLDGGVSGSGTMTFAAGTTLEAIAGKTTISNNVTNNGANLNLIFDAAYNGEYSHDLITGTLTGQEFSIADNLLYNVTMVDGKYTVAQKSEAELAKSFGTTRNEAAAIAALNSHTSTNAGFTQVANEIARGLQSSNPADVRRAVDAVDSLAPDNSPMIIGTQIETITNIFHAASDRMNNDRLKNGISSGDMLDGGSFWVQGLYGKSDLDGYDNHKGYNAESTGVAAGIEADFEHGIRAGIGYAYTDIDINGHNRDNNAYTNTAFIYAEYQPNEWFANMVASYNWSRYKERKYALSTKIKGDHDVDSIGLQAMTGYDFYYRNFIMTPQLGARYIHVKQDSYHDSIGSRFGSDNSDIFTGVLGANMRSTYYMANGVGIRPEVKTAVTYDFVTDDGSSYVTLANGAGYAVNGKALKRWGFEAGIGLTAVFCNDFELSATYDGRFRDHYYDNLGMLTAKYNF